MGFDGIMSLRNDFCGSLKILRSFGDELSDSMKHFLIKTPMTLRTPGINFLITSIV